MEESGVLSQAGELGGRMWYVGVLGMVVSAGFYENQKTVAERTSSVHPFG